MSVPPCLMCFALSYGHELDSVEILATGDTGKIVVPIHELPVLIGTLEDFQKRLAAGTLFDSSDAAAVYDMVDLDDGIDGVPTVAP